MTPLLTDDEMPALPEPEGACAACGFGDGIYQASHMRAHARAVEARVREKMGEGWIACRARMPEEGVAVLIVDIDNEVDIARWDGRKWFTYSRISWARKSVAHWRGRPVTEMSRDELIAALNEVGDELHRLYEYIRRDTPWRQFMPK